MSGQHQANAKCRNSVAAIYNNYTTKTCRIVHIRVHFFRMDCICFVYRICVQFRSAWARPRLAITNFFQPPQKTLKFHNVVNLTKRAVRNDFSSSPETIVQRSWHCDFGKTKIRKPISLLSASAFCCFGHSLPVGSLNSCAYECWNIWREADSCFVHSACLA